VLGSAGNQGQDLTGNYDCAPANNPAVITCCALTKYFIKQLQTTDAWVALLTPNCTPYSRNGMPWKDSNYIRYKISEQPNAIWVPSQIGEAIGTSISVCVSAVLSSMYYQQGKTEKNIQEIMSRLCNRHGHVVQVVSVFILLYLSN